MLISSWGAVNLHILISGCTVLRLYLTSWSSKCTRLCWDVSSQIFHFSLSEEDMKALKGLDRKWKACLLDGWVNTLWSQRLWACRRRVKLSSLFLLTILSNSFFFFFYFSRSIKSHPYYPFLWGSRLKTRQPFQLIDTQRCNCYCSSFKRNAATLTTAC